MKRIVNYRKNQVDYEIPVSELMEKLGIPEPFKGSVYYSTVHKAVRFACHMPQGEKK